MTRSIVAVIVSYVIMFILIFCAFTAEYMLLGPDHAFKPGTFVASNRWIAIAFAVNFVVAVIGGFICAAIAKGGKAPFALALVVFVIGLALAIPALFIKHQGAPRPRGPLPMTEAMTKAEEPRWVPFTFPIVGVLGVLIGAKLKKRS